ncbi:MAG: hypothetical protein ABWK15_00095 [Dissulfuribacterales bacterium]
MLLLSLAMSGCSGLTSVGTDDMRIPHLENIAVLPVDKAALTGRETDCTITDNVSVAAEELPAGARSAVTALIANAVDGDARFKVVQERQCVSFLNAMLSVDVKASQLKLIQNFGAELGADAVLYTKLLRYRERVGSNYSVQKPASVAFSMALIRVSDGAVLWRNGYDETQQPLSENLFKAGFYKETGMHWLTAAELAEYGVKKALLDLKKHLD